MHDQSRIICTFKFLCDKQWDDLKAIVGETRVRYCPDCKHSVFLCSSFEDVAAHAARSECIALQDGESDNYRIGETIAPYPGQQKR